ncbi:hypothetical protein GCM10023198_58480 [Promicromonospora umidemergens]|uniref:Uncharacterized protein n=1 Tax=Promicromonospora umidemergens TaxID=629679 RepID=A0ABP8YCF0_9MICO
MEGRPHLPPQHRDDDQRTLRSIARSTGVSVGTVQNFLTAPKTTRERLTEHLARAEVEADRLRRQLDQPS